MTDLFFTILALVVSYTIYNHVVKPLLLKKISEKKGDAEDADYEEIE